MLAAVNGPAVGIGCSLALAADLIVSRESAYFLLAFMNIGLVPDGGSSLLVPERVGCTRAAEMAMLGERIPARQALEWGLINRVVADDEFDAAVDELAARLAAGPTAAYAGIKSELNALAVRPDGRAARARGHDPAALRRLRRLPGGRAGVPGEAPAGVHGPVSRPLPGPSRPYTADAVAPPSPRPGAAFARWRGRCRGLARSAGARPHGVRRVVPAGADGSPNAEGIRTLYILIAVVGARDLHRRRGPARLLDGQVPGAQGRTAAQIHGNTQLEIGWTVGAAVILIFLTVFTFVLLEDIKNPAATQIDAKGSPVDRLERALRLDRPAGAAEGQRVAARSR